MKKQINIVSGPSREELFDALRLFNEGRKALLEIDNNGKKMKAEVIIRKIGAEDGSGQSWNLVFSIKESFIKVPYPISVSSTTYIPYVDVNAYYSTKNRRGGFLVEQ